MTNRNLLIAIILLAVGIGLVNIFLIPPFMNPDEIQHFMFSANYAYNEKQLKTLDQSILQILKEHKWFHFIGIGPGWESVKKIEDIYFLKNFTREKQSISQTYFHFIYGKLLKLSGVTRALSAFYFLRIISFFVYLVIFFLSLFFYRKYFSEIWIYLISGQVLIYQIGTILNSVNYDVLLAFIGVLFFIISYRFMVTEEKLNLFFLSIIAIMAVFIKTGGLLFFIYLFLLLLITYAGKSGFLKRLGIVCVSVLVFFSWLNYMLPNRFFPLYTNLFGRLRLIGESGTGVSDTAVFFNSVLESFYFHSGWMGFRLESGWYFVLKVFLLIAVIGVCIGIFQRRGFAEGAERKWLVYTLVVFIIQIFSIRIYYGSVEMAQGRYLLPLLIPIVMLIYLGIERLEQFLRLPRNYAMVALLVFQSVFFLFALMRVITVFYLEIASPHPGL